MSNKEELLQAVWESTGERVDRSLSESQIKEFLSYKSVAQSPVNKLRDDIINFIQSNKQQLSLPCDGDCYQHHDGVVLYCHTQLLGDNNGAEETKAHEENAHEPGQG
tara:strand:+ start:270 stop:590 length:321 start_codon:yes stop_codon:yes gene_type:complete